jgi:hypothetical protein
LVGAPDLGILGSHRVPCRQVAEHIRRETTTDIDAAAKELEGVYGRLLQPRGQERCDDAADHQR